MVDNICRYPVSYNPHHNNPLASGHTPARTGGNPDAGATDTFVGTERPRTPVPVVSTPQATRPAQPTIPLATAAFIVGGFTFAGAAIGAFLGNIPGAVGGAKVGAAIGAAIDVALLLNGCGPGLSCPNGATPSPVGFCPTDAAVTDAADRPTTDITIDAVEDSPKDTPDVPGDADAGTFDVDAVVDTPSDPVEERLDGGMDIPDAPTDAPMDRPTDVPTEMPADVRTDADAGVDAPDVTDVPSDRPMITDTPDIPDAPMGIRPPTTFTSPSTDGPMAPLYGRISYSPTSGSLSEQVCYTQSGRSGIAGLEGTTSGCPTGATGVNIARPLHSVAFPLLRSAELCWTARSCEDSPASRCFEWGAIQCRSVDDSVIAHYTFDDGSANDSSGNGNHGTLLGTGPFTTMGTGIMGQAFQGDGSSRYLNLDSRLGRIAFSSLSEPRSFNIRFSVTNSTSPSSLFVLANHAGAVPAMQLALVNPSGTSPRLSLFLQDTTTGRMANINLDSGVISPGAHNVTANYIPGATTTSPCTLELYLDGNLIMRDAAVFNFTSSQFEAFSVGAANFPTSGAVSFFSGTIDDFSIMNRAASSENVRTLHCATTRIASSTMEPAGCP